MGDEAVIRESRTKGGAAASEAAASEAAATGGAILLADGSRDDVALTMRAFEKSGLRNQVMFTHDGSETLDYLFGNGGKPGLVLLALNLSRLSGLEVLQCMRANEPTRYLPVIVLISSEDHREVLENYGLKADGYVCKPIDLARLREETTKLGFDWMVEDDS